MNRYLLSIIIASLVMGLFSCETMEEPDIKNTSTWPLNGEYWVKYEDPAGNAIFSTRHKMIITNTSANKGDSILVSDQGTGFKFKAAANMEGLSFNVSDYPVDDTTNLSISNGKLMVDATQTKSEKVVTDSLYMEMEVVTPSGTQQLTISGYKYTGWPEDNY